MCWTWTHRVSSAGPRSRLKQWSKLSCHASDPGAGPTAADAKFAAAEGVPPSVSEPTDSGAGEAIAIAWIGAVMEAVPGCVSETIGLASGASAGPWCGGAVAPSRDRNPEDMLDWNKDTPSSTILYECDWSLKEMRLLVFTSWIHGSGSRSPAMDKHLVRHTPGCIYAGYNEIC